MITETCSKRSKDHCNFTADFVQRYFVQLFYMRKYSMTCKSLNSLMVPGTGIEPVRPLLTKRRILRAPQALKAQWFQLVNSSTIFCATKCATKIAMRTLRCRGAGELFVQPNSRKIILILDCFECMRHANETATALKPNTLWVAVMWGIKEWGSFENLCYQHHNAN